MSKKAMTIDNLEVELFAVKHSLELSKQRIDNEGGRKIRSWVLQLRSRVYLLEEKIKDLKLDRSRSDEKTANDTRLEEKIKELESFLDVDEKRVNYV